MEAPFGVRVKRFLELGYHPKFETEGCLKHCPNLGPGDIYCEKPRKNIPSFSWTRKLVLEDFSRNLGYRVPGMLKEREDYSKSGGPGTYELPYFLELLSAHSPNVRRNVGFGTAKRFPELRHTLDTPSPDTHQKKLISDSIRPQWTHVCPFEWDGFKERSPYTIKSWHLAPNRYAVPDPRSIAEKVKHKISKRGPYDVSSGPRDDSTIKNHFAPSTFKGAKVWPKTLPSEMDRLKKNERYGKWVKGDRATAYPSSRMMQDSLILCRKDPNDPSPAEYDPISTYSYHPQSAVMWPFGSSITNARPTITYKVRPGPGRYKIKDLRNINEFHSSFRSRVQRSQYLVPKPMNSF